MSRILAPLITVVLATGAPGAAFPQGCCTPGSSPLGGITGGPTNAGSVEVGATVDAFWLHQAYVGTKRIDDPSGRTSRVFNASSYVRIGLASRIVAVLALPVDDRRREQEITTTSGTFRTEFRSRALGDASTLLMARVWPWNGIGPTTAAIGLGLKWPTGRDDARQYGVVLPGELQSGTGTWDLLGALSLSRLFPWGSVLGVATGRFPSRAESGYRFGNEVTVALLGERNLGSWRFGPELRARFAAKDEIAGRKPPNTGGGRLLVGPRVAKAIVPLGLTLEATWLLPVWHNANGLQLGVSHEVVVGARWAVK